MARALSTFIACGALALASGAAAQSADPASGPSAGAAAQKAPAALAVHAPALAEAGLKGVQGRGDPGDPLSIQALTSTVSGNTINAGGAVSSGNIDLSGAALSGFNGIGNFAMNTGHNNSLQSSVNITIVLAAPSGH